MNEFRCDQRKGTETILKRREITAARSCKVDSFIHETMGGVLWLH